LENGDSSAVAKAEASLRELILGRIGLATRLGPSRRHRGGTTQGYRGLLRQKAVATLRRSRHRRQSMGPKG
jgi:hypothetical protein